MCRVYAIKGSFKCEPCKLKTAPTMGVEHILYNKNDRTELLVLVVPEVKKK